MIDRRPSTPGEILREEFLTPHNITQDELAKAMGVSRFRVNEIINGRRALTSETAVLLGKALGTSARFWMNLQVAVDLFDAERKLGAAAASVQCLLAATPSEFVVEMPLA
ncbi:HigA family addiction module antitoxin [Bradyrhizobium sp. C-145]|uniref:HigA family addiction module antitoxin n=1 Tax=Bradyrhizobium TaxID=374 RepID=UPI00100A368D|nr:MULTISPECIES: HigA family addiction module antitoxin [Bradyrhizobium]RXG97206.1 addiction module antidote protein, HigA family [Bradyrhizobium vignae]UQR61595.1 HigA family addiction module antitoxin [Bradyrhizobium sp. C-145]